MWDPIRKERTGAANKAGETERVTGSSISFKESKWRKFSTLLRRGSIIFHQLFFPRWRHKHPWLGLTCLGRTGFNSSTLLVFILVFISCRCWRTALSLGPIQVVSLLAFRTVGTSLAASSGTAGSIASSEVKKGWLIGDFASRWRLEDISVWPVASTLVDNNSVQNMSSGLKLGGATSWAVRVANQFMTEFLNWWAATYKWAAEHFWVGCGFMYSFFIQKGI